MHAAKRCATLTYAAAAIVDVWLCGKVRRNIRATPIADQVAFALVINA